MLHQRLSQISNTRLLPKPTVLSLLHNCFHTDPNLNGMNPDQILITFKTQLNIILNSTPRSLKLIFLHTFRIHHMRSTLHAHFILLYVVFV